MWVLLKFCQILVFLPIVFKFSAGLIRMRVLFEGRSFLRIYSILKS